MPWKHECSLDWLKERQNYLTASEVKKLLPITATGHPRKITDEDRLKILSHKVVELTKADCVSYGAAARGHIMEPYAVTSLNDYLQRHGELDTEFYWWDDEVIGSTVAGSNLGFSPDAADVEQGYGFDDVCKIAEIKSYSDEQHMLRLHSSKETLEERWQIATAMAARPQIEEAYLVFFNPRVITGHMCAEMGIFHYERYELLSEIRMIYEIDEAWTDFLERYRVGIHPCDWDYICYTEGDIYNRYLAEAGVNP